MASVKSPVIVLYVLAVLVGFPGLLASRHSQPAAEAEFSPTMPSDCQRAQIGDTGDPVYGADPEWRWAFECREYTAAVRIYRFNLQAKGKEATARVARHAFSEGHTLPRDVEGVDVVFARRGPELVANSNWFVVDNRVTGSALEAKALEVLGLFRFHVPAVSRIVVQVSAPDTNIDVEERLLSGVAQVKSLIERDYVAVSASSSG